MMRIIGTNIISSLGFTTKENYENVKRGVSGIKHYDSGIFCVPEAFMASLIDKERLNDEWECHSYNENNYTNFEKAIILSVFDANKQAKINLSNKKNIFIFSTTKGNIERMNNEQLIMNNKKNNSLYLWYSAKIISQFFGNPNIPIVVSNACISGAAAQIAAMRELESGKYENAVVIGADFLSKFIISGFQSFKALSPELCNPFDKNRCGLNLGEAAATIIMSNEQLTMNNKKDDSLFTINCSLKSGVIRNDANHISAPSRTGEGSLYCLNYLLRYSNFQIPTSEIAFINAHGTATPYNDAMEAQAIVRAGLENVPVNSLKPFFGHTLGAAGVLESIISMQALSEEIVLPSYGSESSSGFLQSSFENEFSLNIPTQIQPTDKRYFIKMLSGFGGCNAALLFEKWDMKQTCVSNFTSQIPNLYIKKHIRLSFKNSVEITEFYRSLQLNYPKFFKMDNLSKLGFLAAESLSPFFASREREKIEKGLNEDITVICFNRSSSLEMDTQYQATIADNKNYFPSPSLFVYTLPNIVNGEIAIRHKIHGETSFYITENFDAEQIFSTVQNAFFDKITNEVIVAWIESFENIFEVKMWLITKKTQNIELSIKNLFCE
jgi:3-oxoacyl-[acyl-carrier-protein] synthase-1